MKVYIACALTHVPRAHFIEYTDLIHKLGGGLSATNFHTVKYALVDSDPQLATKPFAERARLCYQWDRQMVEESEAIVAECTFPSIGLGIELQIAAEKEIPIIAIFQDTGENRAARIRYKNPDNTEHELQIGEGFVSLMALGLPSIFKVHKYSDVQEATSLVSASLQLLQR